MVEEKGRVVSVKVVTARKTQLATAGFEDGRGLAPGNAGSC